MGGGGQGADGFAGGVFALLAGDGLHQGVVASGFFFKITIDAQPVHEAGVRHLISPDKGDIVFCLTGEDAGVAAGAFAQVDAHAPLMEGVFSLNCGQGLSCWLTADQGDILHGVFLLGRGGSDALPVNGFAGKIPVIRCVGGEL